jgi:hypothetical protein
VHSPGRPTRRPREDAPASGGAPPTKESSAGAEVGRPLAPSMPWLFLERSRLGRFSLDLDGLPPAPNPQPGPISDNQSLSHCWSCVHPGTTDDRTRCATKSTATRPRGDHALGHTERENRTASACLSGEGPFCSSRTVRGPGLFRSDQWRVRDSFSDCAGHVMNRRDRIFTAIDRSDRV